MPRIPVEVDDREYSEALKARGDQPWRKVILDALGIDETPRRIGRPPHMEMGSSRLVSHDVLSDSQLTDAHQIRGLDSGDLQERFLRDMQRRKRGY